MTDTTILLADTQTRVRWLLPKAVRVTHAPLAVEFPPDRPWLVDVLTLPHPPEEEEIELWPQANLGRLQFKDTHDRLVFAEAAPPRLGLQHARAFISVDVPKAEARAGLRQITNGMRLSLEIQPGETFYGWGEQFNAFSRREGLLNLNIRDAIAPLQTRGETYSAIPLFFSSRGYAFWLLNSHTSRWRIDAARGRLDIEADGPPCDYVLLWGPDWKDILSAYTHLSGRPPLPPRWAFGLWGTSYPQGHQESVVEHVQAHRRHAIPLDAVILDYHWEQAFHNFQWRRSLIPQPDTLIERLKEMGVHLGLILTPFLNQRTRPVQKALLNRLAHNLPPDLENDDERALPEYTDAARQGLLAHPSARWWFGQGGMPDFANPAASAWWTAKLRPLYQQGISFFKNDDGEYLPEDARSALGITGAEYHNLYGFYYSRAIYQDMETQGRRGLVYARSAWAGSQRFPALFLGDQKPTFKHMRAALRAGLSLSLQGFSYWTADVFGLDGRTTPETHMRYAQWALLCPVARYFWRPPDIDPTRFPWSHSTEVEANFRRYAELRYRLLPFFYHLAWQAHQTGLPILRPLRLEFPTDPFTADIDDQFLLGESLLVAPVLEAGRPSRRIYLPAGTWHDFWSPRTWEGPIEIDYPAPLDHLPLLVRGGTMLPLGPVIPNIPDDHQFNELELHLYPPYPVAFTLYEDDGATLAYRDGAYTLTHLHAESDGRRLRLHIPAAEGNDGQLPPERKLTVVAHHTHETQLALLGRDPIQDWRYDPQAQRTLVNASVKPNESYTITIE